MANTYYSENYKKRMDEIFRSKENKICEEYKLQKTEIIDASQRSFKEERLKIPKAEPININTFQSNKKPWKIIIFWMIFILLMIFIYLISYVFKSYSSYAIVLILIFIAIILYLLHKKYERWIIKTNKTWILLLIYLILVINILLGMSVYSVEWAFLGFILCAVVFYDSRIDSRFLILPALLLLGYVPFLLIGKQNSLAETIAVFVYYFLVVGVGLQVVELYGKYENSIDFEYFLREKIEKVNWITIISLVGIINLVIIITNRFYNLEIWKWTFVYVFVICLVFYAIVYLIDK